MAAEIDRRIHAARAAESGINNSNKKQPTAAKDTWQGRLEQAKSVILSNPIDRVVYCKFNKTQQSHLVVVVVVVVAVVVVVCAHQV